MQKNWEKIIKILLMLTLIISVSFAVFGGTQLLNAEVMSSASYKIQSDSINVGGASSNSTNYKMEDTAGEIATGESSSANYSLKAGYQQMQETYISMTVASDISMDPLGGVTGGTSNGSTTVIVTTDGAAGYSLSIKASSTPAMMHTTLSTSIADYTPAGADPDYNFSIVATDGEFGFTPESVDLAQKYKDNGATCGVGALDTADRCWYGLSTTNETIAQRTSANQPAGTETKIKFRTGLGASHIQLNGIYMATTTLTAVSL